MSIIVCLVQRMCSSSIPVLKYIYIDMCYFSSECHHLFCVAISYQGLLPNRKNRKTCLSRKTCFKSKVCSSGYNPQLWHFNLKHFVINKDLLCWFSGFGWITVQNNPYLLYTGQGRTMEKTKNSSRIKSKAWKDRQWLQWHFSVFLKFGFTSAICM